MKRDSRENPKSQFSILKSEIPKPKEVQDSESGQLREREIEAVTKSDGQNDGSEKGVI
jgi:hypothetical protein